MTIEQIINQLENLNLQDQELRQAADGLRSAVFVFFDQVAEQATWSKADLLALRDSCLIGRCSDQLAAALASTDAAGN